MTLCLIVDDYELTRFEEAHIAKQLGMQTKEAANAGIALKLCQYEPPDVVLLDWVMPGKDGIEFLKEFRQTEYGKSAYVIMCTAYDKEDQEALNAGANAVISKPLQLEVIQKYLKEAHIL